MMLKLRIHKFYLLIFIIFQISNLYSQNLGDINKQIKIHFEQLQNLGESKPKIMTLNYYPIYEPYLFQTILTEEKNKSGAFCKEYLVSEKLQLLKSIYILYVNGDTNALYNLVDERGKKVYDLLRYNCSPSELGKVDTINQNAINDLINSYNKWYKVVKEIGLEKAQKENINPTSYSKYKWIKEIGYLSGNNSDSEILKKYFEIKNDSCYLNYFISSQNLNRFYNGKSNTLIIDEILILSLLNNQTLFTTNILKFKLQGKEADICEVVIQLEVEKQTYQLTQRLKEKNIIISLNI